MTTQQEEEIRREVKNSFLALTSINETTDEYHNRIADFFISKIKERDKALRDRVIEKIENARPLRWMCTGENHAILELGFRCKTCEENAIKNETRDIIIKKLRNEIQESI